MNRISLDQLSRLSDSRIYQFEPVRNTLIDFYLDGFKKREKNKEKVSIWVINYLIVFSYMVCLVKYVVGFIPMSYTAKLILFDMSLFFGGVQLYNRVFITLTWVFGLILHITLRWTKSGRHREWTQMFEVTRSKVLYRFLKGNYELDLILKLVKAMKVINIIIYPIIIVLGKIILKTDNNVWLIKYLIIFFSVILIEIIFFSIYIKFYNSKMFLLSLFFQITSTIAVLSFFIDATMAAILVILLSFYQHLRINKINRKIILAYDSDDNAQVHRAVKEFTEEHNRYCTHINAVNQFWKNFYLAFFTTMIPINLIIMHQILFEDITLQLRLLFIFCNFNSTFLIFVVQWTFAQLSVKIHSMYAKLSRLQWSLNGYPFRTRLKWKLIMCFERLTSTKHRIGITMGSIVFTIPLFIKVIKFYCLFNHNILILFL